MPSGSGDGVVIVIGGFIVKVTPLLPKAVFTSVACSMKLNTPALVGVPLTSPVVTSSVRPSGSAPPVTDQRKGGTPPDAVAGDEYRDPTVQEKYQSYETVIRSASEKVNT